MTSTTGIGSHKVDGEIDTVIQNSALRDAELTRSESPGDVRGH